MVQLRSLKKKLRQMTKIRQVAHTGYHNGTLTTVFTNNSDDERKAAFEKAEQMNKQNPMELPGDEWLIKEGWIK